MANLFHTSLGKLFVQDRGTGPALLCIHGFLEHQGIWDFLDALEQPHRIIGIDLPGHGLSPALEQAPTIAVYAQMIEECMKGLGIEKFQVLGHSLGGYIGLELLKKIPNSVQKLLLLHSHPFADSPTKKVERSRLQEALHQGKTQFLRLSIPGLVAPNRQTELEDEIAFLIGMAEQCSVEGAIQALEAMKNRGDATERKDLNLPCIALISGDQDPAIPLQKTQEWAQSHQLFHRQLSDCGHVGFLEQPQACLEAIEEWLSLSLA